MEFFPWIYKDSERLYRLNEKKKNYGISYSDDKNELIIISKLRAYKLIDAINNIKNKCL